jgi:hypothetical protein
MPVVSELCFDRMVALLIPCPFCLGGIRKEL